jgi:hypothetical protein
MNGVAMHSIFRAALKLAPVSNRIEQAQEQKGCDYNFK